MKKWLKKKQNTDFYILYTIAFAVISLFIFFWFFLNGKSLVWTHDGVPQHVNSLAYYGRYLREILYHLFAEHKLSVPMWDMHIGYGSDILTTLHYYVMGDPLALLAIFVPEHQTEYLYEILIFLRIYLAGIAFSRYCFYHKNTKQAVFLGTLIYIFAGWTIYASMKHPYFANPMIYLPLILKGIDKIYHKEKPFLFIGMTALAGVSNFYFFYMICIFMFLYAAFRYFVLFRQRSVRAVLQWFVKFLGYYAVAFLMASVILLPVLIPLFGTGRLQVENYVPLLYDRVYYEKFLGCLIGENMIQWGVAGYSAVAMAGVFVLFSKRKKYTALKLGFLMLNLFLLIPFAGHVLNGFSYVSNRWIWAYGMLIAYIFVKAYPELYHLTISEKRRIFLMLLFYCVLALFSEAARTQRNLVAVILLVLSVFTVVSYQNIFSRGQYLCAMIAGILIVSILLNVSYQYSYEKDYLSEFTDRGGVYDKLESGADLAVLDTEDPSIYRYDQYGSLPYDNTSMQMGTNSASYYFSVANSSISRFFREMYLNTPWEQHYDNLDGRTILDRLAAVKYFVIRGDGYGYLPYGYAREAGNSQKGSRRYHAYQNEDALPLGYTYDSYLSRENYEKLTVTEKQQALLQAVVLEKSTLPEAEPVFSDQEIPYETVSEEGCVRKGNQIVVTGENARLQLVFKGLKDSETYLIVQGLDYEGLSPRDAVEDREWKKMTLYEQQKLLYEDSQWRYWKDSQEASIRVTGQLPEKEIKIFTDKYNAYSGRHDFLCNTGYWEEPRRSVTLTFEKRGIYSFDSLKIVCQPMKGVDADTEKLGREALTEVETDVNEIRGKITVSVPKALVLAIPYSKGFRAYVDGKETELVRANTMYMALKLSPGSHEIRLTYRTPYLYPGICLTALGVLWYILLVIRDKKKRGNKYERIISSTSCL